MHSAITALLCVALIKVTFCSPKAAIYIDNGRDQTAIDRLMTQDEKKEMELEILNLLGLPNRPRRINKSPLKKSAPRFLLDIYKTLMDEDEEGGRMRRGADINFSGEEQQQIDQSDVIMTFESVSHHISGVRHERGKRLWFNVTEVPVAEDIVGAELRIYKNEEESLKRSDARYTVTVYQLVNTDDGERELEYVSALNTTSGFTGWLGLNVTACLATWVAFPDSNKGLYLSVHPVDKPGHEVRPEDVGLVTVKAEDEIQPFMVAFLKAVNHVKPRTARDVKPRIKKSTSTFSGVIGYKNNEPDSRRSCTIEALYISFKDLKWQDWIIAPEGYAAYYCVGECNFPLNAHMNATNHAIVQTLVHLMNPWRFPKPCCAPTKLNPISVLYFLDDQNVVLKKYKKMVVKSCGCH
ncbi:hypothetical protein NQ317_003864 [Molorchus minor]|uniref:TGF-beta family profile domain-containing protein n=1 Tax=Molorchus minor TaxID=1323400 RepID=A0ABQ9JCA8_9CUCU|nr:hypothetical protein NQ317_003864 [Molorchus minor]